MVIFIKPENGKLIELNLLPDITIEKLKDILSHQTQIPSEKQILKLNKQILLEGQLHHYLIPQMQQSIALKKLQHARTDGLNTTGAKRLDQLNNNIKQSQPITQENDNMEKEFILQEISKQNIIIELFEYKKKLKIFVQTEKRIAEFEIEPHKPLLTIKQQLAQMWNISVKQQSLRFGGKLLFDHKSFEEYDIRSGDILLFSLKPQQYHFLTHDGYSVVVTQLNSATDINQAEKISKKNPDDIWINPKL